MSAICATLAGMVAVVSAAGAVLAAPVRSLPASTCPYPLAIDGWSPDGKHVAFEGALDPRHTGYYGDGGIVGIVNADGTMVRIVSATPFAHRFDQDGGIVWAPDGRSVVYVHLTVVGSYAGGEPRYGSTLIRVALKTDNRLIVRGGSQPSFGPHGLTYVAPKGIFVDGKLLVGGSIDGAAWSPDGKRLAFARGTPTGTYDTLLLTDAGGRQPHRIARDVNPVYSSFAWSPRGHRIAYVVADTNLYVANVDGSKPVRLTQAADGESFWAWSPDGSRIAYAVGGANTPGLLFIANADGSKRVSIATTDADKTNVFAWSPDGSRIAYTDGAADSLYIANADGSQAAPVGPSGVNHLLWSPDGTRLVADLTLINIAAGSQTALPGDASGAAWSRDSSLLAEGAGNGIQVIRADGTRIAPINICKP